MSAAVAERFGANLVRCRKAADLSQEELGFRANLHRTEIGMLERGVRLARIDTLVKLSGALEVEPADLLDGISWQVGARPLGSFEVCSRPVVPEIKATDAHLPSQVGVGSVEIRSAFVRWNPTPNSRAGVDPFKARLRRACFAPRCARVPGSPSGAVWRWSFPARHGGQVCIRQLIAGI
jgi:transcriptional regulator with XRE-family HTH domain